LPLGDEPLDVDLHEIPARASEPRLSLAGIVNLIGRTRTAAGLRVRCELDRGVYPKGEIITDAQMATLQLVPHRLHGDWNYTINPRRNAR